MEHLWWALGTVGALSRTVLDSAIVYDVIRGNLPTDRWRAGEVGSFVDAAGRTPGRLRIGWNVKPVTRGVKPHPAHVAAVRDTAALLSELGHDVREVDPRYPDPTAAFVPQFFAGIRTEADAVEHYERLERRTRETYRLGSWVTPRVIDFALRQTEKISAKANRVFDPSSSSGQRRVDVLLTPSTAHRPPRVGVLDGTGSVRASLKAMRPSPTPRCGTWPATRPAACRRARGPTDCRSAASSSDPPTGRRRCSAWPRSSRRPGPGRSSRPDPSRWITVVRPRCSYTGT
jgi:amidase